MTPYTSLKQKDSTVKKGRVCGSKISVKMM